ncbi:hypothetical protein PMIT1327_00796 [Prochlorococcus marinus str. MIT 1327]|nr:hypothetical protein PMIT1312_00429 [Prochlorococcus marinus str. MIT 1312]KZR82533.1 hypothetical protein PMIT1327_00796 [Prochlorococcus marinus str. MIT 1327]
MDAWGVIGANQTVLLLPLQKGLAPLFVGLNALDVWAKRNPAKGRVSRLLVGRVSLFPLRGEVLLTNEP